MDNRTCVDRQTYLTILANQREYYERLGTLDPTLRARQAIAAAFVCDEEIEDIAFQKDKDEEAQGDWIR